MSPRWQLPPPRHELNFRLRPVEEAETSIEQTSDARLELRIHHPVIKRVTVPMMAWWFQNFDRACEFRGVRYAQIVTVHRDMVRAWLAHNVEEVGCFKQFLPQLHASAAAEVPS